MRDTSLLEAIGARMGGASGAEAEAALEAVLRTLSERLRAATTARLAAALPERFADWLARGGPDPSLASADAFYARVGWREGVSRRFAIEHAQAVCRALLLELDAPTTVLVARELWPELLRPSLADLLGPDLLGRRALAAARPNAERAIASAAPPTRAHAASVARSDDPHGDRKLSSGSR
jgi:uncharacterized protein (DUF2267 family)